jgi:nucleotide-binding universal stress UspA family protein
MQSEQTFKKILVATDGSFPSITAQELAAFVAKKFGSKVTVLHVMAHELMNPQMQKFFIERHQHVPYGASGGAPPPITEHVPPSSSTSLSKAVSDEITESYRQKGEEVIADATGFFKNEGISVDRKIVEHADPAEAVIREADKGNYGIIVMGQSGEKEQEPHLGSMAEKVSNHATTSVLISRQKNKISKILVPVDGSENSERALRNAVQLAKKSDAQITLLHVQDPGLSKVKPEITKEIGDFILSKAAEQAKGTKLEQKIESGDPAKTITQIAKEGNYDIIIIGDRGHGIIRRSQLGSVTNHVIHYADRSVLIIK